MNAIGLQQALQTLPQLIQQTVDNCEETLIVSDVGAVVVVDQREWENMVETVRLLHDRTSLKALLDGHNIRDAGASPDAVTLEEAFDDLQTEHPEKCQ
jgi:PHD/YefM family antitoxin component YafN of YafNO toxin-antitoxin module